MKLPINFGNKLFFRVVLPGAILTAALARASQAVLWAYGLKISMFYAFPLETLLFGWLFLFLDSPIYMLLEGRRFWPTRLVNFGRRLERARLLSLHRTMRRYDSGRRTVTLDAKQRVEADRIYLEAAVKISGFPLDRTTSMPRVYWPTRLGNLIAAYEQYPRLKYGLDAVFYWPRLWVTIDKDLREEIDNQQALADGLVYVLVALILSAVISIIYSVIDFRYEENILAYQLSYKLDLASAIFCIIIGFILYRASLYSHAQFGELFKSIFDQHRDLLKLDEVIELVGNITADPKLIARIFLIRNIAAWRFLRWHLVRFPDEAKNRRVRLP